MHEHTPDHPPTGFPTHPLSPPSHYFFPPTHPRFFPPTCPLFFPPTHYVILLFIHPPARVTTYPLFHLPACRTKVEGAAGVGGEEELGASLLQLEALDQARIEDLITANLGSCLQILPEEDLALALHNFVEKEDKVGGGQGCTTGYTCLYYQLSRGSTPTCTTSF